MLRETRSDRVSNKQCLTSINLDRICGWIHRRPDKNAGSSLDANSVLTRVSSLETNTKKMFDKVNTYASTFLYSFTFVFSRVHTVNICVFALFSESLISVLH